MNNKKFCCHRTNLKWQKRNHYGRHSFMITWTLKKNFQIKALLRQKMGWARLKNHSVYIFSIGFNIRIFKIDLISPWHLYLILIIPCFRIFYIEPYKNNTRLNYYILWTIKILIYLSVRLYFILYENEKWKQKLCYKDVKLIDTLKSSIRRCEMM